MVQGHYMTISKWKPNFRASKAGIQSTLVWVRLLGLLVEYYAENILMEIGGKIEKAIKIDEQTLLATREKYARIYIQIDMTKPLIPFIWINRELQSIEYEGLSRICFSYGQYGHIAKNYRKEEIAKEKPTQGQNPGQEEGSKKQPF